MDLMKLFGTVLAVFFHPGSASELNGQRICRRGTERPCYKVFYIQDSRWRLTFEDARRACRLDGGELLSIETKSEQRLVESFIQQLQPGDGDFWIGLRRSPQRYQAEGTTLGCPSQYHWLDGSTANFRNWYWDEPSCGREMCVVLYHQPSSPPDLGGHFLFQWNDDNCNSKNNYVCKYPEDKVPTFTVAGETILTAPSPWPNLPSTTERDERMETGLSESSVSLSDTLYLSYILFSTIPIVLLLIAATGFLCYRRVAKRRKTEADSYPPVSEPWRTPGGTPCPIQGPYAFSDISKFHPPALDGCLAPQTKSPSVCTSPPDTQWDDYENVPVPETESVFVTNDIYETCRGQSRPSHSLTGWVENEIYG